MTIKLSPNSPKISYRSNQKEKQIVNGWKDDPRMVYLANKKTDLTDKEIKEWERSITRYQVIYE